MVLETKLSPTDLKYNVCSPGGAFIIAVYNLEKQGLRYNFMKAVYVATLHFKMQN